MSAIPSNLTRVPNLLMANASSGTIARTNLALFQIQNQLATGRTITRFSDDAVKAAAISVLDARLDRAAQRSRNLDHASSSLNTLDQALGEASELVLEAKDIASDQVGLGSSAEERRSQAAVVDSLIQSLFNIANRQSAAGSIFGGSTPSARAVEAMLGGYRYTGRGEGLLTDVDLGTGVPITLGATAIGSTSGRVRGTVDFDPGITGSTRLSDLEGARGLGISKGRIEFSYNGGARVQVDLSGADTTQDVINAVNAAIRDYEQANSVTILGTGGITTSGGSFQIDVDPGSGPPPTLQFFEIGTGTTAQDLGLAAVGSAPAIVFSPTSSLGSELNARLTWQSPIASLRGTGGALGQIKLNNLGQTRTVDLSASTKLEDIKNAIEGCGLGLRVEINAAGTGIDVLNEVAAGKPQAMSIEEITGSGLTASRLGIRSLDAATRIADFNYGRGVQIVDNVSDPITGLPSSALSSDLTIRLGDAGGTTFTVDLRPQDMATVQTVLDRINAEAAAAGINVPADFRATLADGANGIVLMQNTAVYPNAPTVTPANNSPAAQQLGLTDATYDPTSGLLRAKDTGTVRVDNLFTQLIDLRDALLGDDTSGITFAGEGLEASVSRLAETRALVGGYAKRVEDGSKRLEDLNVTDQRARSLLQDTDFAEAASKFSLLQTQLQAALQVTATSFSRSLLDFLG